MIKRYFFPYHGDKDEILSELEVHEDGVQRVRKSEVLEDHDVQNQVAAAYLT